MRYSVHSPAVRLAAFIGLVFSPALIRPCPAQTGLPQLPDPGSTMVSRQQQQQLGLQAAGEVYKQMPVLPDNSPETAYVREIGQRLVAVIPPANSWPFQFHVVAQKEINAFALPGGQMFVNIGTITAASNEAELAGVMAHEMSHVYMQHSAKQMQKAQLTQGIAGLAGAILGEKGGSLASLGQTGLQIGAGMVMLRYSRTDEAQADSVGAIILQRAGYNPQALANFFRKLEAQGGAGPQFLSDHPNPGNREAAIQKQIQGWPPEQYRTDNAGFETARQKALSVKAYSADEIAEGAKAGRWTALNKSNGAIINPPPGESASETAQSSPGATTVNPVSASGPVLWNKVAPSRNYVLSDLGLVRMVRPQNWNVIAPQQQGQSVTIAPQDGVVGAGIGYGVVVNAVTLKSISIDDATAQIVRGLQSGGSDLQPVGKAAVYKVAGASGRSVILQSTSPFLDAHGQPQKEKDHLVTIPWENNTVIYMVFVAPAQDFERLRPAFQRMLDSVQF
ncbi:MAG TPA: M48 family metallopeptidase [Acidobacteriaceae bacterium]|nr:M48 family metallopeptidase [Acidobacteriaceae bacterium]